MIVVWQLPWKERSLGEGHIRVSSVTGPARRLIQAFAVARSRVKRAGNGPGSGAAWNGRMSILFVLSLAVSLSLIAFDAQITAQVLAYGGPQSGFMQTLTRFGLSQWYLSSAGLVLIIAGTVDWSKRGNRGKSRLALYFGQAVYVIAAVALSGILTNIFKIFIGRARPHLIEQFGSLHFQPFTVSYDFASYPSGHSTTAGAVTMVLMLWFPRLRFLFFALGSAVAASRVLVGAHYASDVVAGFSLGFFVALFVARWLATRALVFRFRGTADLPALRHLGSYRASGNSLK